MIVQCFKRVLCLWMFDEVDRFIKQFALASCAECKRNEQFGADHDCYRIRSGQVQYEVTDVHIFFNQSISIVTAMLEIDGYLRLLARSVKNEMLKTGFAENEIETIVKKKNIVNVANSQESTEWILHKIYTNLHQFGGDLSEQLPINASDESSDQNDIHDTDGQNAGDFNVNESEDGSDYDYDEVEIVGDESLAPGAA